MFNHILVYFFFIGTLFADNHILEKENFEAWQFTCVDEQSQKVCDLRELVKNCILNKSTQQTLDLFHNYRKMKLFSVITYLLKSNCKRERSP